jgi:hypothetical protein
MSGGSSADDRRTIGRSSTDQISVGLKQIVSVYISAPDEMHTEIYYFSCLEMRYEIRDFSAQFSVPEMLGFRRTFFCTETPTFGVQFWCFFFAI